MEGRDRKCFSGCKEKELSKVVPPGIRVLAAVVQFKRIPVISVIAVLFSQFSLFPCTKQQLKCKREVSHSPTNIIAQRLERRSLEQIGVPKEFCCSLLLPHFEMQSFSCKNAATFTEVLKTKMLLQTPVLLARVQQNGLWNPGRTAEGSRGYVPGKAGVVCPRGVKGVCCIANWWSLVNCWRVRRESKTKRLLLHRSQEMKSNPEWWTVRIRRPWHREVKDRKEERNLKDVHPLWSNYLKMFIFCVFIALLMCHIYIYIFFFLVFLFYLVTQWQAPFITLDLISSHLRFKIPPNKHQSFCPQRDQRISTRPLHIVSIRGGRDGHFQTFSSF